MKAVRRRGTVKPGMWAVAAGVLVLAGNAAASAWQIEVVDQSGMSRYSSLKLDKEGNAHLAYVVDDKNYTLKYGFWDHILKRWFLMKVGENASFCSLAVDSRQRPHISWADYGTMSGARLHYAYWDGQVWKSEPVRLNSDIIAYYTSIGLDAQDRPSISFYEYRGPRGTELVDRMRVVTWTGDAWTVSTADPLPQSGKFNSLAIDPQGRIHVAYANVSAMTGGMRYAVRDGADWKVEILEGLRDNNGQTVGFNAAIALDKDSNPHVTYMNASTGVVKYAVRKGGRWEIQSIDKVAGVAYPDRNSITLNDQQRPFISYYDNRKGVLKVAYQVGQKWVGQIVDTNFSGFASSVQTSGNTVWISYGDEMTSGLKVARAEIDPVAVPVPPPPPPPGARTNAKSTEKPR